MKHCKSLVTVLLILFCMCSITSSASAQTMFDKLGRGLVNVAFGWFEIPKNIEMTWEETDNGAAAFTLGTLKGIGRTLLRTTAGIIETVTFPIPIPSNYNEIILPKSPFTKTTNVE